MSIFKCKMCGGDLDITAGVTVCECEYCGTRQTVPAADNEKKMTLFSRANRLLRGCEFDKAAGVFESIVVDFPEEAEAYWGLVLCKYGIEYVDDPATGRKVPTCHRSSFDSVMDDANFEQACENADSTARKVYRDEAKTIEELRKGIIEVSGKEEPYDIFICYKETADNGERTLDSVLAQDVYDALTEKGYRVFFSRVTLEDKLGQEYEPYIFAALNSTKVMLAFGTDYDYYNAVWVKNEWSRFLQLIAKGEKKVLIPCYKGIDAYDLPKEFAKLQAQDLGKVGAMQDLMRGIEKILPRETTVAKETVIVNGGQNNVAPLLERAFMFLEDGEWEKADDFCEQVLNHDPKNAQAYLGKLMAEMKVSKKEDLKNCEAPFDGNVNYQKAVRFGNAELPAYIKVINERNENIRLTNIYDGAVSAMEKAKTEANYKAAAATFDSIAGFKDATALAEQCRNKAETARLAAEEVAKKAAKKRKKAFSVAIPIICACIAFIIVLVTVIIPKQKYNKMMNYKVASVGDKIYFGTYEQDNNTSNGKENIEWLVLAKEDNKILVISDKALDCQPYVSLREWMNDTFLNAAFSAEEQAQIQSTAGKNPNYNENPTDVTTDKVFLLNSNEARNYFSSFDARMCVPTEYAIANGAYLSVGYTKDGAVTCWWWLRSPSIDKAKDAVNCDGSVDRGGRHANNSQGCVRPAMWISLES